MSLPRVCARCLRPVEDHTLRELREHHPAEDLNFAYEDVPGGVIEDQQPGRLASAVVCHAIITRGGPETLPGIRFTFYDLDGLTAFEPITIILDQDRMLNLQQLLWNTIAGAVRAARRHPA